MSRGLCQRKGSECWFQVGSPQPAGDNRRPGGIQSGASDSLNLRSAHQFFPEKSEETKVIMTMRTEIRELRRGMNQEPPGDHSESPSIVRSLGSESACQLTCVFNLIFSVARWIYKVTAYSSEEETRASFLSSQQVMGLWFVGPHPRLRR